MAVPCSSRSAPPHAPSTDDREPTLQPSADQLAAWSDVAAGHLRAVAAEVAGPRFGAGGVHAWRTSTQVHTEADELAGAALSGLFSASFPGHGLVIEDRETVAAESDYTWSIDPVDGSANHLRGIPYCSLSAGLARGEQPMLGVVHELLRGRTAQAHRGGGAWCDGERLAVSATAELSDAMAIIHVARRGPLMGRPGALERLLWSVRKIRCMGSIALDLMLVATGEADLLVAGRGRPQRELDILGGLVLVEEAGGVALTADGEPFGKGSRTLVAGPERLARAFCERMADLDLEGWSGKQARRPAGT